MKILIIFFAVFAAAVANTVFLTDGEVPPEFTDNSRYLLWKHEEGPRKGLTQVEDLQANVNLSEPELMASERTVSFYVYTPRNPTQGVQIRESQLRNLVELTGFQIGRPTIVSIHGWTNDYSSSVNTRIKNAALEKHNINFIVVDWSSISRRPYTTAQGKVLEIGNYIGDILLRMESELGHRVGLNTLVGFSLGAHIAGNTGARTGRTEVIVGLDPAGPLFSRRRTDNRLDPTDAKFVQVIHTNDLVLGFGIRMGHADYYPNGGSIQNGCAADLTGVCSHNRAWKFFAESINGDTKFVSRRCSSYTAYRLGTCARNTASDMGGYPVNVNTPDDEYFLDTKYLSPYAKG
ncbi:pancreatic lipase-related protein 3-like [Anthonomus grandis grandis]|uniref:pancreatic lipase-related protein 3-like n=1 Tax=Anthonomus grandis grandis TaxID=2921223 RepID=UPI0021666840|nr:pancreatic lipase-related protein 3-like [Anthonomus grandis grandis]